MKDIIYKSDEYIIIKKNADEDGLYMPVVCLELINICIKELEKWENGGFANYDDYRKVIKELCQDLKSLLK